MFTVHVRVLFLDLEALGQGALVSKSNGIRDITSIKKLDHMIAEVVDASGRLVQASNCG
jgi:hypothetical protein